MTDATIDPRKSTPSKPARVIYALGAAYFALVALFLVLARFAVAVSG